MKIGTNDISKIYLGGSEIEKIYLGTEDVYESGDTPTPPQCEPIYDSDEWQHGDIYEFVENDGWQEYIMDGETATMTETICDIDSSSAWESLDKDWVMKLISCLDAGADITLSATLNGNSVYVEWSFDIDDGYIEFHDSNDNQIGHVGFEPDLDTGDMVLTAYDFASGDWVWTLTYDSNPWDDQD